MDVGLGPGHIVLDGDPDPSQKGAQSTNFRTVSIVAKRSPFSATDELLYSWLYCTKTPLVEAALVVLLSVQRQPVDSAHHRHCCRYPTLVVLIIV